MVSHSPFGFRRLAKTKEALPKVGSTIISDGLSLRGRTESIKGRRLWALLSGPCLTATANIRRAWLPRLSPSKRTNSTDDQTSSMKAKKAIHGMGGQFALARLF